MKKWLWGFIAAVCVLGVIYGVSHMSNDEPAEKAEWQDSVFSVGKDEGREAVERPVDNENNVKKDAPSPGEASAFKDDRVIVDYDYGACNNGCGCTQYAHYAGRKACVNCAKHDCPTSKYDHERR